MRTGLRTKNETDKPEQWPVQYTMRCRIVSVDPFGVNRDRFDLHLGHAPHDGRQVRNSSTSCSPLITTAALPLDSNDHFTWPPVSI